MRSASRIPARTPGPGRPRGRCNGFPKICPPITARTTDHNEDTMKRIALLMTFSILAIVLNGQPGYSQNNPGVASPARPAPRGPDGRVTFGPVAGEMGLWEAMPTAVP